jgi:hypothetical protein
VSAPIQRIVRFHTTNARTGPLTWGQLAMWDVFQWLPPDDATLNVAGTCPIGKPRTLDQVLDCLRRLVERHDSLHTLYRRQAEGPNQIVLPSGQLSVPVHEAGDGDPDELAARVQHELRGLAFDMGEDLPLRAAVITRAGRPAAVVLIVSHMAVDAWSLMIVREDLTALLDADSPDDQPPPSALQPLDRLEYENSPAGSRREARALRHWEARAREIPGCMLESIPMTTGQRLAWARIESKALSLAAHALTTEHRVAPSVVMMASVALLLARYKDERQAALRLIVATRFKPETRQLVGAFNQNAIFHVRTDDGPFGEYLRRASLAALEAYQHCEYDPRKIEALVARIATERGLGHDGYCFFNDMTFGITSDAGQPADGDGHALGDRIAAALGDTRVTEPVTEQTPKGSTFFLFLHELSRSSAVLELCVNPRFLLPRTPADFLRDLETLVVEAATGTGPATPPLPAASSDRR